MIDKSGFSARSMEELVHIAKRLVAKAKQSRGEELKQLIRAAEETVDHMNSRVQDDHLDQVEPVSD